MASTTTTKEVIKELPGFIRVFSDGSVERLFGSPYVPPSLDSDTGVLSKDIVISQNPNISARLYLPEQAQTQPHRKLPILVYFHGGAFCLESAFSFLDHRYLTSIVTEAQVLAVSVEYRLAPEHPLPAAFEDCWDALQWVTSQKVNNGPEQESWISGHGDFGRLFIGGDSAGANIVHYIALLAGAEALHGDARILGGFLSHPFFWGSKPIGNEPSENHEKTLPALAWDIAYPSAPYGIDNPLINPVGPGAPALAGLGCSRLLVCVASKDQLRERGVWYHNLVKESGWTGELELFEVEGEDHAFHIFDTTTDNAKIMIKRLASFLTNQVVMDDMQDESCSGDFDMQLIGNFLSFASRGDRVGLNQMLRDGTSPNVQDYDKRTALHLAASEGHAPIVELLLHYKANLNLKDRWQRTPLTDARSYGHRDICRILEVNGGKDFLNDHPMTVRHEKDLVEMNFDISELNTQHSSTVEQGVFGESVKVKWRGTWVVKTVIKSQIYHPVKMILSAKDNTVLRELRHPNILQFLGSIVHGDEMILITEHLPKGNLEEILSKKVRLDIPTALRYALDIARGMNYLHGHKPSPIVHNNLDPRNLLQDEGGHLKIGEYWVQMLYEQIHPNQENCQRNNDSSKITGHLNDTKRDVRSFGYILYQMLEGRHLLNSMNFDNMHLKSFDFEPKFRTSRCPKRMQQLIENCTSKDPNKNPPFSSVIDILEEVSACFWRGACPVC
ncbi:hypothetical protein Tsubulata_003953 [Turnera subulata]|uniref:Protein kinase domain-containing protein n=1 Tax=Turnera subulata TaxID=218843 RepID=A0A9Q0JMW1_9ROSI|nr:hypothetical protein Tsubulata_003953 [Turnera subulata]